MPVRSRGFGAPVVPDFEIKIPEPEVVGAHLEAAVDDGVLAGDGAEVDGFAGGAGEGDGKAVAAPLADGVDVAAAGKPHDAARFNRVGAL